MFPGILLEPSNSSETLRTCRTVTLPMKQTWKYLKTRHVADLVKYLKVVHKHVDEQHALVRENMERAKLREFGTGTSLRVGDYCLVAKPAIPMGVCPVSEKEF